MGKKIKGKVYSFGRWDDPDAALAAYVKQRDHIQAFGCRPDEAVIGSGIRLDEAIKRFLDRQKQRRDGEAGKPISARHFENHRTACGLLLATFGRSRSVMSLKPADFAILYPKISKGTKGQPLAASSVERSIAHIKGFFNWLWKENLIPDQVVYGADFVPPPTITSQDTIEQAKEFTPAETWSLIANAPISNQKHRRRNQIPPIQVDRSG